MSKEKRLATYLSYLEKKHPGVTGSPGHKKLQQAAQKHADRENKKEVKEDTKMKRVDDKGMSDWWKKGYESYHNAKNKKPLPDKSVKKEDKLNEETDRDKPRHERGVIPSLNKPGLGNRIKKIKTKIDKGTASKEEKEKHRYYTGEETSWAVDELGRFRRVDERAPDLRGGVGAPLYGSVADSPARRTVARPVQRRTVSAPVKKPVAAPVKKPVTSVPAPVRKPTTAPQTSQGHPPGGLKTTPRTTVADTKPTNIAAQRPATVGNVPAPSAKSSADLERSARIGSDRLQPPPKTTPNIGPATAQAATRPQVSLKDVKPSTMSAAPPPMSMKPGVAPPQTSLQKVQSTVRGTPPSTGDAISSPAPSSIRNAPAPSSVRPSPSGTGQKDVGPGTLSATSPELKSILAKEPSPSLAGDLAPALKPSTPPPGALTRPELRNKVQDIAGNVHLASSPSPNISKDVGPSTLSGASPQLSTILAKEPSPGMKDLAPGLQTSTPPAGAMTREKLRNKMRDIAGPLVGEEKFHLPDKYDGEFSVRKIYDASESQ